MAHTGYRVYQRAQVETSTPQKLVLMLFNEACISTELGIQAIRDKDFSEANNRLLKVQDILSELMGALDFRIPLAQSLYQLYEYIYHLLVTGNARKDTEPLEEALGMLQELKETWSQAADAVGTTLPDVSGGVSVAR